MHHKISLFLVLTLLAPAWVRAQSTDTIKTKDSINTHVIPAQVENKHSAALSYIVPGALVTYGALSFGVKGIRNLDYHVYDEHQSKNPNFSSHIDNYLQYTPAAAAYALGLAGVQSKHNLADRTFLLLITQVFVGSTTFIIKHTTSRERPDNSNRNSFVSGHTTEAFAGAEYMNEEYGGTSPWYSAAGYVTAAGTGVLRLYNNKHWLSDVVAGAGLGMLSAKAAYLIYPVIKRQLWHKHDPKVWVMPSYQNGAAGFALMKQF